ncbi:MAG: NADH-quinone oxidoreductase subunit NuoE [Acidobacteria bacterium]|nr:NADH-quinone oxidoreductase subunit NuoE [Acidobacteriota bacterium]
MALRFTEQDLKEIEAICHRYPDRKAATLPTLHFAQKKFGYISDDAVRVVAESLGLPVAHVLGVATFYTMYNKKPVGKYHIQVCTNISCALLGSREIFRHLSRKLGIKAGETTEDNLFTLQEVQCLGSCGTAPTIQINEKYFENMTVEKVDKLVESLKKGEIDV